MANSPHTVKPPSVRARRTGRPKGRPRIHPVDENGKTVKPKRNQKLERDKRLAKIRVLKKMPVQQSEQVRRVKEIVAKVVPKRTKTYDSKTKTTKIVTEPALKVVDGDIYRTDIEYKRHNGAFVPKSAPPGPRRLLALSLGALVRAVGMEIDEAISDARMTTDPAEQQTRIETVIRAQYAKAKTSTPAAIWITERGWGRVPFETDINWEREIENLAHELGIPPEEWRTDPILAQLLNAAGATGTGGETVKTISQPTEDGDSETSVALPIQSRRVRP